MFKPIVILVPDTVVSTELVYVTDTHSESQQPMFLNFEIFGPGGIINDSSAIFVKARQYGYMGAAISAAISPCHRGSTERHSCSVRKHFPTCSQIWGT